jgi:hypothetical protein
LENSLKDRFKHAPKIYELIDSISNDKIEKADFSNLGITDHTLKKIIDSLRYNSSLKELDLSNNNFHGNSLVYISKMLEKNSTLIKLNLEKNDLKSNFENLVDSLKNNNSLVELKIDQNDHVNSEQLELLNSYLSKNKLD